MTTGRGFLVGVRILPGLLRRIDQWIDSQKNESIGRPEAIRRLVTIALDSSTLSTTESPADEFHDRIDPGRCA